eukprot:TRINITY_DN18981_c0_g1_i1.p1 TRINITY_DN18981_c0_g1~~TRINITY_DN18981_c0_g1_i1.p1  ORF type:complete len:191 (+),score=24.54 TRINITY_DN18981_c0_g1_i1:54-626(+)
MDLGGYEPLLAGMLIKIIDDTIDDGIWCERGVLPLTVMACCLVFQEMMQSEGKSVMMTAFTLACCETKGIDNWYFLASTIGVFAVAGYQLGNAAFLTNFHQQMCLMGTAYSGTLATRCDEGVEALFGFAAKTLFRFSIGMFVAQARPFVPEAFLAQHDFLALFILGYFVGHILSIPQLYWKHGADRIVKG